MRATLLVVLTCSALAWADDASEAKLQFELGSELYQQRRFAAAIEHFVASNRLVPNANVVFNIAQTFGLLNRPVDAYNWYETYLAFDPPLDEAARKRGLSARDALAAKVAVLDVKSTPAGADVFVDWPELGALGRTPRRVAVTPGAHRLVLRKSGHREASAELAAALRETKSAELRLEPILGALQVQTEPPGANVTVEPGGALGQTPLTAKAPVGTVNLVITLEGHVEQTRTVEVRDGQTVTVQLKLERAASSVAVLTVQSAPPGAVVSLDGRELGAAPLSLPNLPPGPARLSVTAPSHDAWSAPIVLEAGGATRVDVHLVNPSSLRWRGWRWLGYGAGAAALVAGGVLAGFAVNERSAFFTRPGSEALARVHTLNTAADVSLAAGAVVLIATLVVDLVSGPRPSSSGTVTVDR